MRIYVFSRVTSEVFLLLVGYAFIPSLSLLPFPVFFPFRFFIFFLLYLILLVVLTLPGSVVQRIRLLVGYRFAGVLIVTGSVVQRIRLIGSSGPGGF